MRVGRSAAEWPQSRHRYVSVNVRATEKIPTVTEETAVCHRYCGIELQSTLAKPLAKDVVIFRVPDNATHAIT